MNKSLFNPKEELKRPSIYFLENYAENILKVAKVWQEKNAFSLMSYTSVRLSINIFIADLESDLSISNDKKYKIVWDNKYSVLTFIRSKFLNEYEKELEKV